MGDLFHHSAYFAWVDLVVARMILAPQHTYIILTKRPDRMLKYLQSVKIADLIVASSDAPCAPVPLPAFPLRNVMLMTTVENQAAVDARLPSLLECGAMGWRTGVSIEPMLTPVDLARVEFPRRYGTGLLNALTGEERGHVPNSPLGTTGKLSWVIAGGETGPGARPMHPDWIRSLRDQCAEAGTPFFFKGWGEWGTARIDLRDGLPAWDVFHSFEHYCTKAPTRMWKGDKLICPDGHVPTSGCKAGKTYPMAIITRVGKRKAGRLLDGREHNDFPENM
jgi:protein gp37